MTITPSHWVFFSSVLAFSGLIDFLRRAHQEPQMAWETKAGLALGWLVVAGLWAGWRAIRRRWTVRIERRG